MKILSKADILSADDLKREIVEVPEWGGAVYVRVLPGRERDAFEERLLTSKTKSGTLPNVRASLCAAAICDESGKPLFDEKDIAALGERSGAALTRVFAAASKINRLSKDDVAELEGNS